MKKSAVTLLASALLGAMAGLLPAHAQDDEAKGYVLAFCSLKDVENGMALIHLASPALQGEIRAALAENAKAQAAAPDEKPPLGDGIPWQSVVDRSDTCEAGAVTIEGERTIVEVRHGYAQTPDANFSDRIVFVTGDGGVLLLDDVLYGESGEDSLRGTLKAAFAG